jgi:hypothetical protein
MAQIKSTHSKRRSASVSGSGTPIQQFFAKAFSRKRKGYNYASDFEVKQHEDKGRELEIWYRYFRAWELVMWLMPDGTALIEARILQRKRFLKLLFKLEKDFGTISNNCTSLPALRKRAEEVVASFDESLLELVWDQSDSLEARLKALWHFSWEAAH